MFKVKPMRVQDFGFAVDLANTMDWDMAREDFEFMAALEPEGCLVAYDDAERVGLATCIGYGTLGWFGNLIVEPQYRNRGVGTQLVNHAITYLRGKGVRTIGLYAYPHLKGFYSGLGFKADVDFTLLKTPNLPAVNAEAVPRIDPWQMGAVEALDHGCFGGDRKKLLQTILQDPDNLSGCIFDGETLVGYVVATVYAHAAWVGPLICRTPDAAVLLVKAALARLGGKVVYAAIPSEGSPLQGVLAAAGFREQFSVTRMYLGVAPTKNCIYMAESLERG